MMLINTHQVATTFHVPNEFMDGAEHEKTLLVQSRHTVPTHVDKSSQNRNISKRFSIGYT